MLRSVLLVVLIALSVPAYVYRNAIVASRYIDASPSDFTNYHEAARALAEGRSPYDTHNFDYPPFLAFAVRPLASLPYREARQAWYVVNHAAMLAAALLTWIALGRGLGAFAAVAATWGLCGTVAENLVLGQVAPLIVLLAATSLFRRPAASLGVAAALKVFPGVLLFREALARRWRSFAAGVSIAALFVVIPLIVIAPLPGPATPASAGYWMGTPSMLNVSLPAIAWRIVERPSRGVLPPNWITGNNPVLLVPHQRGRIASVLVSLATLIAGGIIVARRRAGDSPATIESGAWMALAIVASPIAWYHYAVLLFPAIAAASLDLARSRRFGTLAALVLAAGVVSWHHVLGVGRYVATHGWTAEAPFALCVVTTLPAVALIAIFAILAMRLTTPHVSCRSTPLPRLRQQRPPVRDHARRR